MNSEEISTSIGLDIETNQAINNVLNSSDQEERTYGFINRDNIGCLIFGLFLIGFTILIIYEHTEKKIF